MLLAKEIAAATARVSIDGAGAPIGVIRPDGRLDSPAHSVISAYSLPRHWEKTDE
jgi:hypothetical protein